jgi:hypothetical protein
MHPNVPYFILLLCLTQDDFTCKGGSILRFNELMMLAIKMIKMGILFMLESNCIMLGSNPYKI